MNQETKKINKEVSKEIIAQGTPQMPSVLISQAIEGGIDLEKLEKVLALQERWEANEARKAYHAAMTLFKANPPKINKDKAVSFETKAGGNTSYYHATLSNVTEKISTELSKYGLSASWVTQQNGGVSVTCRITHVNGHSEATTITAPADNSGSKNSIQAIGSTITYLERYTLLALTGLATYDQDDDGQSAGKPIEYIDEKQANTLLNMLIDCGASEKPLLKYLKVNALEEIQKQDFQKAVVAIERRKKAVQQ